GGGTAAPRPPSYTGQEKRRPLRHVAVKHRDAVCAPLRIGLACLAAAFSSLFPCVARFAPEHSVALKSPRRPSEVGGGARGLQSLNLLRLTAQDGSGGRRADEDAPAPLRFRRAPRRGGLYLFGARGLHPQ